MTPRYRLALAAGLMALSGCSDAFNSGPIGYSHSPELAKLRDPDTKKPKTELQRRVVQSLDAVFGDAPQKILVPRGAGLPDGGIHLADRAILVGQTGNEARQVQLTKASGEKVASEGGYSLYRKHCLHCHGVSGDGEGPTAAFLWPRPRDYRRGIFKFTSTNPGEKPTRADLRKTLYQGIANSSMPAFEALMTESEIEQVIDYVIFLSARGETEFRLIGEAGGEEEPKDSKVESPINAEKAQEIAQGVFDSWKSADSAVLNPPIPRTANTRESIARGRTLFLGLTTEKLACAGCHGNQAHGDGPSFVPRDMFHEVVFGGDPATQNQRLVEFIANKADADSAKVVAEYKEAIAKEPGGDDPANSGSAVGAMIEKAGGSRQKAEEIHKLWTDGSLDDWKNPLRPANINDGPATMYKGGRRPLDIYWRIAKGINGAKMPAHATTLKPEQIWDLVNFVLALPYDPEILRDAPTSVATAAGASAPSSSH